MSFVVDEWIWMDRRSRLASLDVALIYLRRRLGVLVPIYVAAAVPLALVMILAIDAVSMGQRSLIPVISAALTAATLWRWIGLAFIQRRVQEELCGTSPAAVWRHLGGILGGRLLASFAMTWGSLVVAPGIWGFFVSGFVTPAALEPARDDDASATGKKRGLYRRISQATPLAAGGRATAIMVTLALSTLLVLAGIVWLQILWVMLVMPSFLGLSATDLILTMKSMAWVMTVGTAIFFLFDFYWAVAGVFLFYDQQSRRTGTDLRLRMNDVTTRNAQTQEQAQLQPRTLHKNSSTAALMVK